MVESAKVMAIEIEVPITACSVFSLLATPYTTDDRLKHLVKLANDGGALPFPVVRPCDGGFEVIWGWDIIRACEIARRERVRVISGNYSDTQTLEFAIVKHVADLKLHWTDLAEALNKAKQKLKLKDERLSEATGINRTKISRYIRIARRLSPAMLSLAKVNRISYTSARELVTLPITRQEVLARDFRFNNWLESQLLATAFPKKRRKASTNVHNPTNVHNSVDQQSDEFKSPDIKKLEEDLTEIVGNPVMVEPTAAIEEGGKIRCKFFTRLDMLNVISQLRKGFQRDAEVRGELVLLYDNPTDLQKLTSGIYESKSD